MRTPDAAPALTRSRTAFKQSIESKPRFSSPRDRRAASDSEAHNPLWL
jgi:hypothetical protein